MKFDYPNDPYCHPLFQTMTGNNDANKPAAERVYNPDRPNAERLKALASMLAYEVRAVDPTRPVTLAAAFRSSLQRSVSGCPRCCRIQL